MMSNFICQIFNESGDRLRINLSQSHPAWMDMLNLLCGAKPLEWVDDSSHNKLFICSSELKVRIHEICSKYKSQESNLSVIEDYFNNQVDNSRLAFLREGALLSVDNNLVKKAVFMVRKANFFVTYNVISFGDKEEYTGPNDLNACVCRFCGKKYPEVRFKKKNAHAIPDALGNKLVFCNDECQSCNAALSPIDKELAEYLKFRRSENKIVNKKNKIIKVWGHNFFYDGSIGELKISRLAILEETESKYYVKLEGAEPITHLGIYKALAKIAIDLMPRNLVDEFRTTIDWIKGGFVPKVLPNVFYAYRDSYVCQPLAKVFVRQGMVLSPGLPKCIVALTLVDLTFFFIVPLGKSDPVYGGDYLKRYMDYLIQSLQLTETRLNIEHIDMADRIGKFAHVKDWIDKGECEIVDQSEFDNTQEKSPNKVDFPSFEPSLVNIFNTQITIGYLAPNAKLSGGLRIEDSTVNIISQSICPDIVRSVFRCFWEIEIQTIYNRETVLKAQCEVYAGHKCISKVCSVQVGEISSFFIAYMLDAACKRIGEIVSDKFHKYDFSQLAEYLMESDGHILHPKEGAEQSVMKALR